MPHQGRHHRWSPSQPSACVQLRQDQPSPLSLPDTEVHAAAAVLPGAKREHLRSLDAFPDDGCSPPKLEQDSFDNLAASEPSASSVDAMLDPDPLSAANSSWGGSTSASESAEETQLDDPDNGCSDTKASFARTKRGVSTDNPASAVDVWQWHAGCSRSDKSAAPHKGISVGSSSTFHCMSQNRQRTWPRSYHYRHNMEQTKPCAEVPRAQRGWEVCKWGLERISPFMLGRPHMSPTQWMPTLAVKLGRQGLRGLQARCMPSMPLLHKPNVVGLAFVLNFCPAMLQHLGGWVYPALGCTPRVLPPFLPER